MIVRLTAVSLPIQLLLSLTGISMPPFTSTSLTPKAEERSKSLTGKPQRKRRSPVVIVVRRRWTMMVQIGREEQISMVKVMLALWHQIHHHL